MFNQNTPIQGSLLISEPFIMDPNFDRSVILLCEQHKDGTVGLVLNHLSNVLLSDVIDEVDRADFPLYIGGPVQNDALFFLHRVPEKINESTAIGSGIYWGGALEHVLFLINEQIVQPDEIKFFLGYSGWAPGQLDEELDQNSWAVHQSFDPTLPFLVDGEDLWKQALISLGPKYAHVANFPKSPNLN